jgi:integrase
MVPRQPDLDDSQLWLFDPGVDVAKLKQVRDSLLARQGAAATERAYRGDWADFTAFCKRAGRRLPATAETLELYLVDAAERHHTLWTMRRRITGIRAVHRALGMKPPETEGARKVLLELARSGYGAASPKRAITGAEIRAMSNACDNSARGLRDRALLLLGFSAGLRRSELVGLDLADVTFQRSGVELHVRRSKTDQTGEGRVIGVWMGKTAPTCPVRALQRWMKARGPKAGPLFVGWQGVRRLDTRLDGQSVAKIVRRVAAEAGIDAGRLGGHSLRAGCVTAAIQSGASLPAVMERTGHKSIAMLARYYRPAGAWSGGNPLDGVL